MVADGYKDTEIGVIPVEWEVVKLKELCNTTTGKLNANAMVEDGKYKFFTCAKEPYLIDEYKFDTEALLISGNGANVGYIHYYNGKFNAYQRTYVLDKFTSNIQLIKYTLQKRLKNRIDKEKNAGNTPYITLDTITDMKIPLPPLKEQEKIADILSTADEKIDAIATQIKKAETLKKGLLQKLLNEGIGHSKFKDSEIGKIPESWEVGKLEDVLTIKYGKSQKDVEDINGDYPILGTGGIMGYANNYLYDKPSVLIGRKGTIDKPQYMETPFWTVDTLFYTELKKDIYPKFVYYIFQTIPWKKYNEASGVPSLSKPNIHNIATVLLPIEEQKQIAEILSTADEKLEVLRAKKEKYETLKKGLLQKLLSGEVRV
jgi:type I restriction enzyme S subunit